MRRLTLSLSDTLVTFKVINSRMAQTLALVHMYFLFLTFNFVLEYS